MLDALIQEHNARYVEQHTPHANHKDDTNCYLPDCRTIKAATYVIRKSWSDEERARRHVIAHSLATHIEGSNAAAVADLVEGAPVRTVRVEYDKHVGVTLVDTDR
jgi:hypothetical protein